MSIRIIVWWDANICKLAKHANHVALCKSYLTALYWKQALYLPAPRAHPFDFLGTSSNPRETSYFQCVTFPAKWAWTMQAKRLLVDASKGQRPGDAFRWENCSGGQFDLSKFYVNRYPDLKLLLWRKTFPNTTNPLRYFRAGVERWVIVSCEEYRRFQPGMLNMLLRNGRIWFCGKFMTIRSWGIYGFTQFFFNPDW